MDVPLTNMRAFNAVARLLSFTQAATELHLSQSAVSQQIAQFEERLGFVLFIRLTRRLELTEEGRRLYETVRRCLSDIDTTIHELQETQAAGNVTISVGTTFAKNWLIPRLADFAAACPGIDLRIKPSDTLVDLQADRSVDIVVKFAQKPGPGFVTKDLGPEKVFAVCSPVLLHKQPSLQALEDLGQLPLLHNEVSEQEEGAAGDWTNWLTALGTPRALDVSRGVRLLRSDLLVQAAIHGQGAALVWSTMVENELRDGRLAKVFGGRFEATNSYYATCLETSFGKPKIRAVMDWLTDRALHIDL